MPLQYVGNAITKAARAAAGGGFESDIESPAPEPTGDPVISSVTDNGNTITIAGSNFGTKAQAAPRYWEMGSEVIVNGSSTTPVAINSTAPDPALWGSYTAPDAGTEPEDTEGVRMLADNLRHAGVDQHWRAFGKGDLLDPLFLNDLSGPEGHKFYFAYWLYCGGRFGRTTVYASTENYIGTFNNIDQSRQIGELCDLYDGQTLVDSGKHQINWISPNGVMTVSGLPGRTQTGDQLIGKRLVGQQSGAEITISIGSETVYPSSVKHMRAHQAPMNGPNTFYVSHSNVGGGNNLLIIADDAGNYIDIPGIDRGPEGIGHVGESWGDWVLLEILGDFSDTQNCWDEIRIGGQRKYLREYSVPVTFTSGPILPANIGMDSPGFGVLSVPDIGFGLDFGEMYFDNYPFRVMLTDAPTLEGSTKFEIQRPTAWADDSITVAKYEGELAGAPEQYVHVLRGLSYSGGSLV